MQEDTNNPKINDPVEITFQMTIQYSFTDLLSNNLTEQEMCFLKQHIAEVSLGKLLASNDSIPANVTDALRRPGPII